MSDSPRTPITRTCTNRRSRSVAASIPCSVRLMILMMPTFAATSSARAGSPPPDCNINPCAPGCPLSQTCLCYSCDDFNPCTWDGCDGRVCVHGPSCPPLPCASVSCNPGTGECTYTPTCTTEQPCAYAHCDSDEGCQIERGCNDENACTTDACINDACVHTGISCDDSDACTSDWCDPDTGGCHNQPIDCNDNNPCTSDSCDPQMGCMHQDNCPPTDACHTYTCNGQGCQGPFDVDCDDDNNCTDDSCDPETGCVNEWNCPPSEDLCLHRACGENNVCYQEYVDCNDNNACTADTCISDQGCVHTNLCEDNNPCTYNFCNPNGACGTELLCPDNHPCNTICCLNLGGEYAQCASDPDPQPCSMLEANPPVEFAGCPGTTLIVTQEICNTGDCPGTYAWTATPAPGESNVTVTPIGAPDVPLGANACANLSATVEIHDDAPAGAALVEFVAVTVATSETCGPAPVFSCDRQVAVTVIVVDMDSDANNDGVIDVSNEPSAPDDSIEAEAPGKFIFDNYDFDEGKLSSSGIPAPDNFDASPISVDGELIRDEYEPVPVTIAPLSDGLLVDATIVLSHLPLHPNARLRVIATRPSPAAPYGDDWVIVPFQQDLTSDFFRTTGANYGWSWWAEGARPGSVELTLSLSKPGLMCEDTIAITSVRVRLDAITSGSDPVPVNPAIIAPMELALSDFTLFTEANTFELTVCEPYASLSNVPHEWSFNMLSGYITPLYSLELYPDGRGLRVDMPLPSSSNLGTARVDLAIGPTVCTCVDTLVRNIQPDLEPGDFRFHVKAHLCMDSTGAGTVRTAAQVSQNMSDATKVLSQCGIIVSILQTVTTIVPTEYLDVGATEHDNLFDIDEDESHIDIYFVPKIQGGSLAGVTLSPFASGLFSEAGIAIADIEGTELLTGQSAVRTLAHELGHYFLNNAFGDDHVNDLRNVMYSGVHPNKRDLTEAQCLEMRSDHAED